MILIGCDDDSGSSCGDGVVGEGETCDGSALAGNDCPAVDAQFTGGALACNDTCDGWDTSGCTSGVCGNGELEAGEVCDGALLGGNDCTTIGQGLTGGTLACGSDCQSWDTSNCTSGPCGNGVLDPGEPCDGELLDGQDCTTLGEGFTGGVLACNETCDGWYTALCTYDVLSNIPEACQSWGAVAAWPGEENGAIAVRLTPQSYPFTVHRIEYEMAHATLQVGPDEIICNAELEHDVQIFLDASDIPPTAPVFLSQTHVESTPVQANTRIVTIDLGTPITVEADDQLYIVLNYAGVFPEVTCWVGCADAATYLDNRDFFTMGPDSQDGTYIWDPLSIWLEYNVAAVAYGAYQ